MTDASSIVEALAMDDLLTRLEALLAKATPGPWETDSEYDGDGLASCGGGCTSGWHNYFIGADIDGKWRTLLDTVNSDHKLIEDDRDEDGGRSWDAIGHANANLVADAVTALPALIAEIRSLRARLDVEREATERREAFLYGFLCDHSLWEVYDIAAIRDGGKN